VYSGGTEVTVTGSNLDSVAEPRITLTVIISRLNDTNSSPLKLYSSSQVWCIRQLIVLFRYLFI